MVFSRSTFIESYKEIVVSIPESAVSPAKGVPVEFIENVIRNQMIDSINELREIINTCFAFIVFIYCSMMSIYFERPYL